MMGISAIDQGSASSQAAAAASKDLQYPAKSNSSASGSKKDSILISQKAKDLAALQAGQAFSEEASESVAVKQQEASGS